MPQNMKTFPHVGCGPKRKASGSAVFALGAAVDVGEGFHGVLSKGKSMHLEKTPPPYEGRGLELKLS
jgi:hypothetical protein